MLAADPERLLAAFEFMAKYGISGVIGGGSAEGGAAVPTCGIDNTPLP